MAANQDDNPTTTITTNISNHPSSVIIDNVDPNNQEKQIHCEIKTSRSGIS